MKAKSVKEIFKEHKIKVSFQRIKIYDFLMKDFLHPTVDEIYQGLITEIPTLSKTTVYNNLAFFIKNNLVREIKIDKNEARYELNRGTHGHFKCNVCSKIEDFEANFLNQNIESLNGYEVNTKNLFYFGTCKKCLNTQSK